MKKSFLQSIKGKVIIMGSFSLIAAAILGYVGLTSLNRNGQNNEILSNINRINLYQYENQSLETSFLYFLEDTYLARIVDNLDKMDNSAKSTMELAGDRFGSDISSMTETIKALKANYEDIRRLGASRGYTDDVGAFAEFVANDEALQASIKANSDDKWVDAKAIDLPQDLEVIAIDGKNYVKFSYDSQLPGLGKRNQLIIRISGSAVEYKGELFVNNLAFYQGEEQVPYDMTAITSEDIAGTYGVVREVNIAELNAIPSFHVGANFSASNGSWEEVYLIVPINEYEFQNFDSVSYDLYLEVSDELSYRGLSTRCTPCGLYGFGDTLNRIGSTFTEYTKLVVEGKDMSGQASQISSLFTSIIEACDKYFSDKEASATIIRMLNEKQGKFDAIHASDKNVIELKKLNIELSNKLTLLADEIRNKTEAETAAQKTNLYAMILIVLVIITVILAVITVFISRSMSKSVSKFKATLKSLSDGDMSARADVSGRDEFSEFGHDLNVFAEKLSGIIDTTKKMSGTLKTSGDELDDMASDSRDRSAEIQKAVDEIYQATTTQASEVEFASSKISDMGNVFTEIVGNIENLTETANIMGRVSRESSEFMNELSASNEKTVETFARVSEQIYKTNDAVARISEATNLITSIAEQTNLLSLNASIEAARVGEAGKGFAVVASEIKQLSEQSGSSTKIIQEVIEDLKKEAAGTVSIVNEVTAILEQQNSKLEQTRNHFTALEDDVKESTKVTARIREYTSVCDKARKSVEEVIIGLSAISEENVASTEQTNSSMAGLNNTIETLVNAASELTKLANELDHQLSFFTM